MKKRLISVAVGLALLGVVMWLYNTLFLNAVLAAIGAIAVYEAARAVGVDDKPELFILTDLYLIVYLILLPDDLLFVYLSLFTAFVVIMLAKRRHYTYKETSAFFAAAVMIALGLGSIVKARGLSAFAGDGRFMLGMGLGLGWMCDTLAFTFGKLFGKRKLCPSISPNKTVEGALGGVIGTPIFAAVAYWVYAACEKRSVFAGTVSVSSVLFFLAVGLLGSVVGIFGDLAASYIKRECGIKDFGNIMPGHGGALDRIDSVLFTSVFSYFCFYLFINFLI